MAETRFEHRGHKIVIDAMADTPKVTVDGDAVRVSRIAPGLYANQNFPHMNFTSLEALARAVIDHSATFYSRRDAKK